MIRLLPLLVVAFLCASCIAPTAPKVTLIPLKDRVRVEIGGQLFTEYIHGDGASRPYCHPVLAADGTQLARDFPMKDTPGEETDHPWQRSVMFVHGLVNGIDFWNEGTGGTAGGLPKEKGRTVHEVLVATRGGTTGTLHARNRWLAPDGRLICTDDRRLSFHATAAGRFIDFEITLHARPDAPLLLGDTKEGVMAFRVAQWMTLPHKALPGNGHIVTSTGERDAAAWGKRAAWCDYHAPRDGQVYGVAIFDHPDNLRHPTWWMAREYGLFAANSFGQRDFEPEKKHPPGVGNHTIPAGDSLTLRYRFYFHLGDDKSAEVARHYADFAAGK